MRSAEISRKTKETDISIKLNLDGTGEAKLDCPIGFMVHMLNTFARHSLVDLEVYAKGDLEVDQHHLVEDIGIVLFPMDETLARVAVDISGRPFLVFDARLSGIPLVSAVEGKAASSFQIDTIEDFWQGFTNSAAVALHIDILRGRSDHHKIEALFKAAARAIREAVETDPRYPDIVPSTKGTLA